MPAAAGRAKRWLHRKTRPGGRSRSRAGAESATRCISAFGAIVLPPILSHVPLATYFHSFGSLSTLAPCAGARVLGGAAVVLAGLGDAVALLAVLRRDTGCAVARRRCRGRGCRRARPGSWLGGSWRGLLMEGEATGSGPSEAMVGAAGGTYTAFRNAACVRRLRPRRDDRPWPRTGKGRCRDGFRAGRAQSAVGSGAHGDARRSFAVAAHHHARKAACRSNRRHPRTRAYGRAQHQAAQRQRAIQRARDEAGHLLAVGIIPMRSSPNLCVGVQ